MIIGKNSINKYQGFAISSLGYSHKNGICQDNSAFFSSNKMTICAVCDGHGDERCFRSEKGSKLGVDIAIKSIKTFVETNPQFNIKNEKDVEYLIKQLKEHIIFEWNEATLNDFKSNPLSIEETNLLRDKDKAEYLSTLTLSNYQHIYGSTFVAGLITDNFWLILQLGDGDAVLLDERGLYLPMPKDDKLQFQYTTSLCEVDAIDNFRHIYGFTTPISMILSTDGLKNSYKNYDYFLGLYKDILNDAKVEDTDTLEKGLIEDLPVLSKIGSGDDISIAISYDKEKLIEYKL